MGSLMFLWLHPFLLGAAMAWQQLRAAMQGHLLGETELMGTFRR